MPALNSYNYAVVRVMPLVERGEFINAGVILYCRARRYLKAQIALDKARLLVLFPRLDPEGLETIETYLELIPLICAGGSEAGPIGEMTQGERWHWLVSPRSTIIQVGPAHSGLCADPAQTLERLVQKMVLT